MRNPFILIGIFVIILGICLIVMGLGSLGKDLPSQIMCSAIGVIAIIMGITIIQLMKDDSLYCEIQNPNEVKHD